jgi:hypothetical protein
MKSAAFFATAAILGFAGAPHAGVIYQTGFENPPFTPGPIAGQDGWSEFGSAAVNVENAVAASGSQAVAVDGASTTSQSGPFKSSPTAASKIVLSGDIKLTSSADQGSWQFAALGPGLSPFDGGIDIGATGDVFAITAGFPTIGSFSRDVFHSVRFVLNYNTQTYSVRLDGVTLASGLHFCGDNGPCAGAPTGPFDTGLFDTFGGNNTDTGYLDNYSVTTFVPEPSTWAVMLLGLGVLGASLRGRRRRLSQA